MRSLRILVSAILVAASLGWAAQVSVVSSASGEPQSGTLQPQADPEGTVRELYADHDFFHVRNALPPSMVQRFSCCFSPDLIQYLESHNQQAARWIEEHKDESLKLPMAEGPIFLSNYEGADTYRVGEAEIDGSHAQVPVFFSYTYGDDTFRWLDIVMLRLINGIWLMDDIQFDPERWDDYRLRQRVSLDE